PEIDWDWVCESITTYENRIDQTELDCLLTEDVCEELEESVQEIVTSSNSDEVAKSKFLEWQNRHPVLAFLLIQIFLALLINIVSAPIGDFISGVLNKKSKLYNEPTSTSTIVFNVDINQNVIVVDEVPYYYEVVFVDAESGEENTGFIYKPNVTINDEENNKKALGVNE
ncbi:MAG: hypothetical protein IJD01_05205, partial [Clostridia bacterium]|nr:hypothetical protein [Clostridia bacterium]